MCTLAHHHTRIMHTQWEQKKSKKITIANSQEKYHNQQKINKLGGGVGKRNGYTGGTGIYLCPTHAEIRKTVNGVLLISSTLFLSVRACARQQDLLTFVIWGGGMY